MPDRFGGTLIEETPTTDRFGGVVVAETSKTNRGTRLDPAEESRFLQWKSTFAPNDSGEDYDLRGAFRAGIKPDAQRGHFPDTFKLPNHPTFSEESKYSGGDVVGGRWATENGHDVFYASPANLKGRSAKGLQDYFAKNEPEAKLILPPNTPIPAPTSKIKEPHWRGSPVAEQRKAAIAPIMREGAEAINSISGVPEIAEGVRDLGTPGQRKEGLHKVITGGMKAASLPGLPYALATVGPAAVATSLATGAVTGKAAKFAAKKMGAEDDTAALVEDIGNIVGAGVGGHPTTGPLVRGAALGTVEKTPFIGKMIEGGREGFAKAKAAMPKKAPTSPTPQEAPLPTEPVRAPRSHQIEAAPRVIVPEAPASPPDSSGVIKGYEPTILQREPLPESRQLEAGPNVFRMPERQDPSGVIKGYQPTVLENEPGWVPKESPKPAPTTPAKPPTEDEILNSISQGLANKPFKSLNPIEQKVVRGLAEKAKAKTPAKAPETPPAQSEPVSATPDPPKAEGPRTVRDYLDAELSKRKQPVEAAKPKTDAEVARDVAADLKKQGVTHADLLRMDPTQRAQALGGDVHLFDHIVREMGTGSRAEMGNTGRQDIDTRTLKQISAKHPNVTPEQLLDPNHPNYIDDASLNAHRVNAGGRAVGKSGKFGRPMEEVRQDIARAIREDAAGQPAAPSPTPAPQAAAPVAPSSPVAKAEVAPPVPAESRSISPTIAEIPTEEIHVDAPRFQFKANVGKGGAGEELKAIQKFDPEKAGVVSVWRDPADGKTYVVNGHHRVDLANRLNEPTLTVRYLNAPDAQAARMKGALINIAEGRGTPVDAAKVFRDSGMDASALEGEGVSLKGEVAAQGLALADLNPFIFEKVVSGDIPVQRGAIIGRGLKDQGDQMTVLKLLESRERSGRRMTNEQLEEMIRLAKDAPRDSTPDDQGSLFGAEDVSKSLIAEKAEVSEYIRRRLSQDKKLFSGVGTEAIAERLGAHGNTINASENAAIAKSTAQAQAIYDKLSSSAGEISNILNAAAEDLAHGKSANEIKESAYSRIREDLERQAKALSGSPAR